MQNTFTSKDMQTAFEKGQNSVYSNQTFEDFMLTNFVFSGTEYKSYLAEQPE